MLIVQIGDRIAEVGYNFLARPYTRGAQIKDHPDIEKTANMLRKLKVPTLLPKVEEIRVATSKYELLNDIVVYTHKYYTILLNLNTGCQYLVPIKFRSNNKEKLLHYGDIPCYAYEWNNFERGITPFHIVNPPEVLYPDIKICETDLLSEVEHWDSKQIIIREGSSYIHMFKSKKEHTLIRYKTRFQEPYIIPRETRESISRWHSVLCNPSVDTASIDTLLYT